MKSLRSRLRERAPVFDHSLPPYPPSPRHHPPERQITPISETEERRPRELAEPGGVSCGHPRGSGAPSPPLFLEASEWGLVGGGEQSFGCSESARTPLRRRQTGLAVSSDTGLSVRQHRALLSRTEGCLLGSPNYTPHRPTPCRAVSAVWGRPWGRRGPRDGKGFMLAAVPTPSAAPEALGASPSLLSLRLLLYRIGGGWSGDGKGSFPARMKQGLG